MTRTRTTAIHTQDVAKNVNFDFYSADGDCKPGVSVFKGVFTTCVLVDVSLIIGLYNLTKWKHPAVNGIDRVVNFTVRRVAEKVYSQKGRHGKRQPDAME
jgi:predicted KAP-like P-loop ATPase